MKKIVWLLCALFFVGSAFAASTVVFPSAIEDPIYYNELGFMLSEAGNMGDAQTAFSQAVELDAEYANAWKNLGVAAFHNEDYATARDAYAVLLDLQDTKEFRFDYAQSLVHHARFVSINPTEVAAELELAHELFVSAGDYPNAAANAAVVANVLAAAY
jgi:tetratricopeptide (TPR) repeat protein